MKMDIVFLWLVLAFCSASFSWATTLISLMTLVVYAKTMCEGAWLGAHKLPTFVFKYVLKVPQDESS